MGIFDTIDKTVRELLKTDSSCAVKEAKEEPIIQQVKKFIFRPDTLENFIGQENVKDIIRINIEKVLHHKPVHFIFSGQPGHGKTTLAYIVAKALKAKVYYVIGGSISANTIADFLLWSDKEEGLCVLLIDEIHSMEKGVAEILYPLTEDFAYGGESIKPFILIGATTERHTLLKTFQPLVDRCGCTPELGFYTPDDIKQILWQAAEQLYPDIAFNEEDINIIADNARCIPRVSLAWLDDLAVCRDIKRLLKAHQIVYGGLNNVDVKLLTILSKTDKPIGEEAMATFAGIDRLDYRHAYEPYLLRKGYVTRTPRGRVLTDDGRAVLNSISK